MCCLADWWQWEQMGFGDVASDLLCSVRWLTTLQDSGCLLEVVLDRLAMWAEGQYSDGHLTAHSTWPSAVSPRCFKVLRNDLQKQGQTYKSQFKILIADIGYFSDLL